MDYSVAGLFWEANVTVLMRIVRNNETAIKHQRVFIPTTLFTLILDPLWDPTVSELEKQADCPFIQPYMCTSTTAKKSHEDFVSIMELFDLMYIVCISEEKLTSERKSI